MLWLKTPSSKLLRFAALAVLALVAVGVGLGVCKMRELNTQYSMSQFMPKDHPLYVGDRIVKKTFRLNEREPVIVNFLLTDSAKGTWLRKDRADLLDRVTTELAGMDHVEKVLSLANIEIASSASNGAIQVDKLLSLVPEKDWNNRVLNDPLITPGLISRDGRKVTMIADIPFLTEAEMNSLMSGIRSQLGKLVADSGAEVMVTGVLPIQSEMTVLLSKELVNFLGLAFLVCLVTLLLYFRSLSTVFVCLVLIIIANVATFTALAILRIPFSVLSSALPIMCSIEALAIASHTLLIFGDNYRQAIASSHPPSKAQVVWSTYKSLLFPNFLMSTTTIIGFATLISSQVPLIRQFSESVSCGILLSCICMQIALPSLMYLFPIPVARSWTGAKARWALWGINNRRQVIFGTLAILTIFVISGFRLNWSVQLYDDLPKVGDIKSSADLIDSELGGMIPLEIMIKKSGEDNPWYEPARLSRLKEVLAKWRSSPDIGSAIGLPDLLNTGIVPLNSRKAIAETLFLYGFSGADNPTVHFLSTDGNSTRLSFRFKDVKADEMSRRVKMIEGDVRKAFPDAEVTVGGMAVLAHPLNAELSGDLIYGLWESLFLISVLLVLVFRSVRLAFVAAVPNLLAPIALLVTMAYLKTPIKPVVAIIFSIALGLAYNNTVFLLTRLKKIQSSFKGAKDVITRTWYQEGNPCLFASLSVIGGFAIFLASYFSPNRTFGAYMLWSIAIGILGDLIVLPALLQMFPWFIIPADESNQPLLQRAYPRGAVILAVLFVGMGPSAAAAAERNVVHAPFEMSMKKTAFSSLLFDGVIAKSLSGEQKTSLADIHTGDSLDTQIKGISVDVKYAFTAPVRNAMEWDLASQSIAAELNIASISAHKTEVVHQGLNTITVHFDGTCSNVKLVLPAGSASASGKLDLIQQNGAPRMLLKDFQAKWTPGSWQIVSLNCTGPQGFDQVVGNTAKQQLATIDPFLDKIETYLQQALDENLGNTAGQEIRAANPFQPSQSLLLKNFETKVDGQGNLLVNGDAYFAFSAAGNGCGADVSNFSSSPKVKSGDTALFLPFEAVKAILACVSADGSLAFDTDSQHFPAFQDFMNSEIEKDAVWPDLNRFDPNTLMKFHGSSASAPVVENEKSSGSHAFSADLQVKMNITMLAPPNRSYIPYVDVRAYFVGPVNVTLAEGKASLKPEATSQVALQGDFDPSYVSQYHPSGTIDWTQISTQAEKALLEQGWSFTVPTYSVSPSIALQPTDGDLEGTNLRLGFQVFQKK
jgi:predicted RND superfamily exporter protein